MLRSLPATLGLVVLALTSCAGETPNSGIGERAGAKGRIVGYLYDADTGAPVSGATVETVELGAKVTTTTSEGYFTLDGLTASGTYRVTFAGAGFVTRVTSIGIQQVPADAYDTISVANAGNIAMAKPSGIIKGRVEFANQIFGQATAIGDASIVVDYQGTFALTKTTTSNAQGEFTLDGLPATPTGQFVNVCAYNLVTGNDSVADFVPTCVGATLYSNQTTPVVIRPSLFDLNNSDINLVQGVVRDVLSRLPVEGVEVFEVGKESEKVTTDANGFYFLKTTSVNRFCQYVFRKTGYGEGYTEITQGRGGNNSNTNITLYPSGATVEGRLFYANLQPAVNAEVRLDMRTGNNVNGFNVLQIVKTDATGAFTLNNLPGAVDGLSTRINVTPWTADPELFPETPPQSFNVLLYPGAKTPLFAQLQSSSAFTLVANNVTSGFIPPVEPVTIQLSLPSIPAENLFTLTESSQSGGTMPFTVAYTDNNRRIAVTPAGLGTGAPLWSENRQYTLSYRLRANNGQTLGQNSFSFTPRTSLTAANIAGRITTVALENPEIDATSRNFTLRWSPLPDAFNYSIYVRTQNTNRVPSFVRLGQATSSAAPTYNVNLPGNLGTNLEPASGQPFAFGQVLTFLVVPIDSRGIESDFSKGATLDVRDVVPPRIDYGIAQLDGAAGASHPIRFAVRATEVMDRTQPPTTTLPAGLAFTSWAIDETSGGLEGVLTLTGSLSAVANLSVQPRDTSGNLGRATTIPVLQNALVPNQNFEGASANTCSASGWTVEPFVNCATCTQLALTSQPAATVAIPGTQSAFDGTCSLGFGDPDNLWCGTQQAWAPMDLSGATFDRRTLNFQFRFWPYSQPGFSAPTARCEFYDTTAMVVAATWLNTSIVNYTNRTWTIQGSNITPLLTRTGRVRCFVETTTCGVRGSAQFDDFRVYMK